ncbi:hypothetical protein THASP1DRAFT_32870 [Thamnocephalis sphaerospora]|uniref:F-box domain-containing protein n=1 Tax=Thamnocephalis sphaerospora TaxID=78915 RepID=A0A4P9XHW3_9FUNG|nr:hypothetical protein THASP1DRAFT_32870 [Thamnocephalis sphaerospora]|eukprot:RKP05295.1 hypothetical protein THASP1DRAFT_32870 [Thamnocephalis sphaerospora]
MNRMPKEIFDRIVKAMDETTLAALSCTSQQWRARISRRQKWWRERFEQQFPQSDDNEWRWLCQYKRAHFGRAHNSNYAGKLPDAPQKPQLDWFAVYCSRRAAEYRWRHGQCMVSQSGGVSGTRPHGIRLQSIPLITPGSHLNRAVVASQWMLSSQQQSVWLLERLCWDGVSAGCLKIWERLCLDEHLVVQTYDASDHRSRSLHIWRFDALNKPPRTIVASKRVREVHAHRHWLIGRYELPSASAMFAYNFANGAYCSDVLDGSPYGCIQRVTASDVLAVYVEYRHQSGPVTVSYKLWRIAPSQPVPFQCKAAGSTRMSKIGYIRPLRVDDNRFIVHAEKCNKQEPKSPPTLALLAIVYGVKSTSLTEIWTRSIKFRRVQPISSRNLLLVDEQTLLSLVDGSQVHRVHLECWRLSGLYPLENQWTKMTEESTWHDPKNNPTLNILEGARQAVSSTAILYSSDGSLTLLDYAECLL